jgi:omega-amidase
VASETLNIAIVQPDSIWLDADKNRLKLNALLKGLSFQPDLILLPEMFSTGFCTDPAPVAESMDGPTVQWMKKTADDMNCAIAGSLIICDHDKFYNRLVFVDRHGTEWYDKRHLFCIEGEENDYTAGTRPLIVNLGLWRINFLICYDLRFPVWSRNRQNYDLLVYSSNWPAGRSDVWNTLLRARAMENQSYVAGVNRVGKDGNGIEYIGESVLIDPKGKEIATLVPSEEGVISMAISLNEINNFRTKFPAWKDADGFSIDQWQCPPSPPSPPQ